MTRKLAAIFAAAAIGLFVVTTPLALAQTTDSGPFAPADDDLAIPASSLAGTQWRGEIQFSAKDKDTWDIEFRADGVMHYVYSDGRIFDNGRWRQRGAVLSWDTNSMFSAALGLIRGDEIRGTRINIRGDEGTFVFTRVR